MKKIIIAVVILALIGVFIASIVITFKKDDYPRPTKYFYVNDYADALLPGSRHSFFAEGERLYNSTKDEDLGGAQVVVTTILCDNEEDVAKIDRTELFRRWKIGENDMGLLILLFFMQDGESLVLISAQIEIGYRMEQFVTAARAGYLIDNCLYNPEWNGSIDMGLGEMYYELLSTIYIDAYNYESFNYDMEVYRDFLINYTEDNLSDQIPIGMLSYIFSPYSSAWSKLFAALSMLFVLLGGGSGIIFARKGGGGSSGGYGISK